MIHIAIVEDDDVWANTLNQFLAKYEKEEMVQIKTSRFHDGDEIVEKYPADLDIILMDIEMGLLNGMDAAEYIRKKDERVIIIFVTNMAQYAIHGYRVNALDYILKPITYGPFAQSLKRAIQSINTERDVYVTVKFREGIIKLHSKDILWIESRGHHLTFHVSDGKYETTVYSMKEMEEKLGAEGFCRCNSGSLVNLRKVQGIRNGDILLGDVQLKISKGRKTEFMSALVNYMTE